ncbi:UNVERIFIED_CONTAM: hypothetical protein NO986_13820 [Comamonas sp. A-3]|uniref:Uncharacterized protein n=1 Tax=Comamonas thiooxydans TaxID=363952 RepID=A0AA42PZU1_9BURK|nr:MULTISPECIES: PhaM family polyhydroxyalkanoate granule multifunctional regulatory protein [Comamonas]EFI61700.1 hypothetical protein CTS44_11175 [Comamonas thiooxydans]MDH1253761.1 hypothetical protein [Comamonas thiooxydans]MDH1334302.1 hypothetical protein [Comamonas thiooxydans]MDH1740263.1 hypothetical protein [Comamonas thiooxydans]MDH1786643.1 hypothetical protein [Comamonas thiooxydans]
MSGDASAFGFGKFIPGFDFLQGLAQSAGAAANPMGRVPQWVAPTVSVEEVDKRIAELKAVQFWLEQNSRALAATIQALEVQRMTLSTLKDMNVSMSELAKSFPFPGAAPAEPAATGNAGWPMGSATATAKAAVAEPLANPAPEPEAQAAAQEEQNHAKAQAEPPSQAALNQAMQWWGALTQQFQQIAAKAMAEPVPPETLAAAQRATEMASGFAKSTMEKVMAQAGGFGAAAAAKTAATGAAKSAAAAEPRPARKAAAKTGQPKTAASKTAAAKKTAAKQPAAKKTAAKTSATSRKP